MDQVLVGVLVQGDAVGLQVSDQALVVVQQVFLTNLANVPNLVFEQMFAILGNVLAGVHLVFVLEVTQDGGVEAAVVALLTNVDGAVLVDVRIPDRGRILVLVARAKSHI